MKPKTLTRRSTVALASAALVLSLAACGSEDDPEVVEGATEQETTEQDAAQTSDDTAGDVPDEVDETGDDTGGETTEVSSEDVEAARAGLARYLEENRPETPTTSTDIPGCPVLDVTALEAALAGAGYPDTTLGGWATEIEWGEYADISPDLMGVTCGGDSDGDPHDSDFETYSGLAAVDLTGHTDFETFVGMLGIEVGDEDRLSACPAPDLCTALWHQDGLVIGVTLTGEGVDEATIEGMLDAVLPEALSTLAAN